MSDPQGDDRPSRSPRQAIDDEPAARRRLGRAYADLLAVLLAAVAALAALLLWHLARRGRLIRERLGPPRPIDLPDPADDERTEDRP